MKKPDIKTIFFDVGGVLLVDFIDQKLIDLAQKYDINPNLLLKVRKKYRPLADLGLISDSEFWSNALKEVGVKAVKEDFEVESYMQQIDGTLNIVNKLKQKGYRIAILSNDSKDMALLKRKKYNFDELFDDVIFSCDLGIKKPDVEMYRIASNRLTTLPEQAIFIDDRLENIEAAKAIGMYSIIFRNPDLLEKELNQLKVIF